jgi:hypothetical protein
MADKLAANLYKACKTEAETRDMLHCFIDDALDMWQMGKTTDNGMSAIVSKALWFWLQDQKMHTPKR